MAEHSYEQVMTALRNADAAGDTEAATRLASIAQSYQKQPPQQSTYGLKEGAVDFAKGTVGTVAGLADLAVGLPKMAVSAIAAPIRTAIYGDPNTQRNVAQQASEDVFGTPSQGLAKLGVPEDYLQGSKSYQTMMKPFELLAEGVEAGGNKITDITGSKDLGGTAKQLADVAMIAAPIPGVGLVKRGGAKLLEPFSGARDATTLRQNLGYEGAKKTNPFMEKVLAEDATKAQPTQMPRTQTELDLGQPNQFGHRPSEFTIDENGIPIRRNASLEAQETVRQGDLFSLENQAQELRNDVLNRAEPAQEGFPVNREYLKQQETELAYQQKAAQDATRPEESLVEPSQHSIEIENPQERTTNRPSPNRGKFGQGGAIDPDVFLKDFPEFIGSAIKDTAGKLKVLYHGTSADKIFDNFKANKRGIFLTDEPSVASMYAKDNDSKGPVFDHSSGKYVNKNTADRVIPVYANIKNPYKLTEAETNQFKYATNYAKMQREFTEKVKAQGHDGIIYPDGAIVAFDPKQIVSATSPKQGQLQIGKSQRGSIGFFGKDPFEKFSEETKQSYPDATPEQIKRAWDLQQAEHLKPQQNRAKQEAITKMVGGNINDKLTVYDGSKPEDIVAAIQTSPELAKEPGTYQKWFAPKGQIAKELVDNPGVNAGISRIKHITDTFARKSETELFGPEGIITRITKFENPLGPGKMSNLFKERFKAKNDPAYKQALNNAEREIDTALDTLFTKNLDEVNKVLVAEGKEPLQGVHKYFPSIFDGKFVFEVRKNGGKPVLMTSHNRNQYNLMRDLMQAEGLEVGPVRERAALQNRFGDTDHLVAEYQMMLDFMDSKAPEVVAVRNAMEGIEQASATTTAGYHNRFKESRGYQGNLGNNPYLSDVTNFYDAKRALTRYQEAHNAWLAAKELTSFDKQLGQLKDAPSSVIQYVSGQIQDIVVKRGVDSITAPMTDLVKSITGISESKQLSAIRQYANLNTVRMVGAGSMRALTQNFFQPIEAILPKFLQMYPHLGGGKFDIVSPALHGLFDYFQVLGKHNLAEIKDLGSSVFNLNNTKLENDLFGVTSSELYKTAVDTGLIDPTVLESTPLFDRKLAQGSWKFGSGLISRSSEQAARFATFSTFTRWLIDAGVPKEQAILQAKQWTEGHMVDYSIEAKPGFMTKTGVVGEAAGRLQTFKATQLGRYVVYIQEAMKSGNTKPLAAMLTINLMLAGLQGMIGMDVLSTVLDGVSSVSKDPKDKEFSFRRWVSEKAPEWANWGVLSTTTGLGLFNAFSQQSIGDGSLANMFPVYAGAAEQGRAVFRRATTDWETEDVGEKARQLSAFAPSSLQPRIDRELLTQDVLGKKTAISKFTNQPVYTYQEGDYSVGNISPFEKSKQSSLRNEMRKEGERFTTGKKDLEKALESKAMDIYAYGKKNAFNQKAFDNMVMDFVVGYKGNPEILDKVFKNLAIKSGMTKHELVRLLQMNKVDYEQLPEVNRMLKYSELMEKRK